MSVPQSGIGARLKALLDLSPHGSQIALAIFFLAGTGMAVAAVFYENSIGPRNADRLFWFGVACCACAWVGWLLSHRDQDLAGAHPTTASFEESGRKYEISIDPRSRTLETQIAALMTNRVSGIMFAQPALPAGMVDEDMTPVPDSASEAARQAATAQQIATEQREQLLGKDHACASLPQDTGVVEIADTVTFSEFLARAPISLDGAVHSVNGTIQDGSSASARA